VKPTLHRGAIAKHPRILAVRVLTREDLACLRNKGDERRVMPRVKAFRDTHHRLARLCAAGIRIEEILRITGYSYQRLYTMQRDPAFKQLVEEYRGKVDAAFVSSQDEFYETSTSNMLRAERQIEEHLDRADEDGELLPMKLLMGLTSDRADRFGYGKKTVNTNINLDFAKNLERMMASRGQATVIDARANAPPSLASGPQDRAPTPEAHKSAAASAGFRRRM